MGSTDGGPGSWQRVNESMSPASKAYQEYATGVSSDYAYVVTKDGQSVKFDGYIPGADAVTGQIKGENPITEIASGKGKLLDAKGGYSQFVDSNGKFYKWFETGKPFDNTLAGQASRQLKVAGDTPIEWRVREAKAVPAIQARLSYYGFDSINVVHHPY